MSGRTQYESASRSITYSYAHSPRTRAQKGEGGGLASGVPARVVAVWGCTSSTRTWKRAGAGMAVGRRSLWALGFGMDDRFQDDGLMIILILI